MKLIYSFTIAMLMATILLISCRKKQETEPVQLNVDRPTIQLSSFNGSKDSVNIQSNGAWTLSVSPDTSANWLFISYYSGTGNTRLTLVAKSINITGAPRTAKITITPAHVGSNPIIIEVTQSEYQLSKVWSNTYGGSAEDVGKAVAPTLDGGHIIAGYTTSRNFDILNNRGEYDMWVVKVDQQGNKVWSKTFGGSNYDGASAIIPAKGGGYIVAGYTLSSDGDVISNAGYYDILIVKLDESGNKIWTKTYGGAGSEYANSLVAANDGGYIIAAEYNAVYNGWKDLSLLKIDENGNTLWTKVFGKIETGDDIPTGITAVNDGYVISGHTSTLNFQGSPNHGLYDFFALRINNQGNKVWAKTFGGTGSDMPRSLAATTDGYILTGSSFSNDGDVVGNHGNADIWVVKMDLNGKMVWAKTFGGTDDEQANSIIENKYGYLLAGYTFSTDGDVNITNARHGDMWLLQISKMGTKIAGKTFGGSMYDEALGMVASSNDEFLTVGATLSNNDGDIPATHGNIEFWALKIKVKE